MLLDEMKCIMVLLRSAIKGEDLGNNALCYFASKEEFEEYKSNLFTLISMKEIVDTFYITPSFSLSEFLKTGIVPGMYDQGTEVPEIGYMKNSGYRNFYNNLIQAIKNSDYSFDSSNCLSIYNDDMAAVIPQVWLYRLGQAMKKETYERVYFYNKSKPERLRNKEELLEYLRRTKTFLVEMSSSDKIESNITFSSIEANVNYQLKGKEHVAVEDIMALFKENVPKNTRARVSKYKVSEEFFLIRRAEQLGSVFYDEPIEVQEKFLNKWMLERLNSKTVIHEETQKFILLSNSINDEYGEASLLDKDKVVSGLFQLYVRLMMALPLDFSNVSMCDFKLKAYMDEETQMRRKELTKNEEQSAIRATLNHLSVEARKILAEINDLDVMRDFDLITEKRAQYVEILENIDNLKRSVPEQTAMLTNDIAAIAFDNDKIMSLIYEATRNGRVYVDKNNLVIELYNKDITVPVFKTEIHVDRLLEFVENVTMSLEDYGTPTK